MSKYSSTASPSRSTSQALLIISSNPNNLQASLAFLHIYEHQVLRTFCSIRTRRTLRRNFEMSISKRTTTWEGVMQRMPNNFFNLGRTRQLSNLTPNRIGRDSTQSISPTKFSSMLAIPFHEISWSDREASFFFFVTLSNKIRHLIHWKRARKNLLCVYWPQRLSD